MSVSLRGKVSVCLRKLINCPGNQQRDNKRFKLGYLGTTVGVAHTKNNAGAKLIIVKDQPTSRLIALIQ